MLVARYGAPDHSLTCYFTDYIKSIIHMTLEDKSVDLWSCILYLKINPSESVIESTNLFLVKKKKIKTKDIVWIYVLDMQTQSQLPNVMTEELSRWQY